MKFGIYIVLVAMLFATACVSSPTTGKPQLPPWWGPKPGAEEQWEEGSSSCIVVSAGATCQEQVSIRPTGVNITESALSASRKSKGRNILCHPDIIHPMTKELLTDSQ